MGLRCEDPWLTLSDREITNEKCVGKRYHYKHLNSHYIYKPCVCGQHRQGGVLFTGLDYWTGLLDWTTGLTFFATKNQFMLCN